MESVPEKVCVQEDGGSSTDAVPETKSESSSTEANAATAVSVPEGGATNIVKSIDTAPILGGSSSANGLTADPVEPAKVGEDSAKDGQVDATPTKNSGGGEGAGSEQRERPSPPAAPKKPRVGGKYAHLFD
jgi:hypothetical protein